MPFKSQQTVLLAQQHYSQRVNDFKQKHSSYPKKSYTNQMILIYMYYFVSLSQHVLCQFAHLTQMQHYTTSTPHPPTPTLELAHVRLPRKLWYFWPHWKAPQVHPPHQQSGQQRFSPRNHQQTSPTTRFFKTPTWMLSSRLGELLSGAQVWRNSPGLPEDTEVRLKGKNAFQSQTF